jgi:hypothetical protein
VDFICSKDVYASEKLAKGASFNGSLDWSMRNYNGAARKQTGVEQDEGQPPMTSSGLQPQVIKLYMKID